MPQIANIVISDGTAIPVAYTFSPMGKDEKGVFWFEQTTPIPVNRLAACRIGYKQSSGSPSAKSLNTMTKVVYSFHVPTAETISVSSTGMTPPPTLAYRQVCRVEFDIADRSSMTERDNLRSFAGNFLLSAAMAVANIDTNQPSYA